MILTGKAILEEMQKGNIIISPFNEKQLNPNSYNLKLHNELLVYDVSYHQEVIKSNGLLSTSYVTALEPIDMLEDNPVKKIIIPEEGLVLYPGILYLGRTVEYTETHNLLPNIDGRSSIGRLGMSIHVTAGKGDIGFCGSWVAEITVVQPLRIYPNIEFCQIYYEDVRGEIEPYNGHYQKQMDIIPSRLYTNEIY